MVRVHPCKFFNKVTIPVMIAAYKKKGYAFFTNGDYNLNLFAIRNTSGSHDNTFNDLIGILYKVSGEWKLMRYDATVDPGYHYLQNPMSSKGCAIMTEGQHRGAFKLGMHQGKYKALVQNKNVKVYRDNNKDTKLDFVSPETGFFGINLHYYNSKKTIETIGTSSAGCSVVYDPADLASILAICEIASKAWGNSFTYTIFLENEVFA